jgi:hypothetical protein
MQGFKGTEQQKIGFDLPIGFDQMRFVIVWEQVPSRQPAVVAGLQRAGRRSRQCGQVGQVAAARTPVSCPALWRGKADRGLCLVPVLSGEEAAVASDRDYWV